MNKTKLMRYWPPAALLVLFGAIVWANIGGDFIDLGGDSSQYIILSESLAKGLGYRAVNYPGAPFFYHYPPLFSLLLAPACLFAARNFILMRLIGAGMGLAGLWGAYRLFRSQAADRRIAWCAVFLLATSLNFIMYSCRLILSDVSYLCISIFTLIACHKYRQQDSTINRYGWLTAVGLVAAYFTRYAGISLLAAGLVYLLNGCGRLKDKAGFKKAVFVTGLFALAALAWTLTAERLNPGSVGVYYSSQLATVDPYQSALGSLSAKPGYLLDRFIRGSSGYCLQFGNYFFFYLIKLFPLSAWPLSLVAVLAVFWGLWLARRDPAGLLLNGYFLIYLAMVMMWPFDDYKRFGLAILPLAIFYFLRSFKNFTHGIFAGLLILNLLVIPYGPPRLNNLPAGQQDFLAGNRWLAANLPAQAVVMSRKPTVASFYSAKPAVGFPFSPVPRDFWSVIKEKKVTHILADGIFEGSARYLWPFILENRPRLRPLFIQGNTVVFEVVKDER